LQQSHCASHTPVKRHVATPKKDAATIAQEVEESLANVRRDAKIALAYSNAVQLGTIAKNLFGCPQVTVQVKQDRENEGLATLVFRADVSGDIPDLMRKRRQWQREAAKLIGQAQEVIVLSLNVV
jgi:hypothetical protein